MMQDKADVIITTIYTERKIFQIGSLGQHAGVSCMLQEPATSSIACGRGHRRSLDDLSSCTNSYGAARLISAY